MKDDRGPLDLTRKLEEQSSTIEGYKMFIEEQKKEIFELKKIASENEKNKNLLQGYKKVIEDLSSKLRKDS
mgnify:FL=1|jgi:hypothetical protein